MTVDINDPREISIKTVEQLLGICDMRQVLMTMEYKTDKERQAGILEISSSRNKDFLIADSLSSPEERFCKEVIKTMKQEAESSRAMGCLIEKTEIETIDQPYFYVPPDAQTLIADAALKELSRNDCELVRSVHLDDPDLMTDLMLVSSLPLPVGDMDKLENAHRETVASNRLEKKKHTRPSRPTPTASQKTNAVASKPQVQALFKDCQDSLREIQTLIAARFPANAEKADQVVAEGLEKAFAASSRSVETTNQIQKVRSMAH